MNTDKKINRNHPYLCTSVFICGSESVVEAAS